MNKNGRIVIDHTGKKYKDQEEEEQSSFRTGRSCTDNIFCSKQLTEKHLSTNPEIHLIFIDWLKAYDTIPLNKLCNMLRQTNISVTLIKTPRNRMKGQHQQLKLEIDYRKDSWLMKTYVRDAVYHQPF